MPRIAKSRTRSQIGAANRRAGRELERAAQLELERAGLVVLKTGSGQGGVVDLIALAPCGLMDDDQLARLVWRSLLIQCKTAGYVPPADRAELAELGTTTASGVLVAYWHKEGRAARAVRFRDLAGERVTW